MQRRPKGLRLPAGFASRAALGDCLEGPRVDANRGVGAMCRSSATVLHSLEENPKHRPTEDKGSIRRACEEFSIRRGQGHREVARFAPIGNLAYR